MPLVRRCCICGRLCGEIPHSAEPYRTNAYACDKCYIEQVIPSKKWKESRFNRYANEKSY